ncbi:MAG: CbiX/SirB N-terminal domain-containing protein [Candidatus Omnitrophica bacterium]|nr:CbiX/SirB N-terminal domain-containing protein [Candidatus Omnitrophota bacterium]
MSKHKAAYLLIAHGTRDEEGKNAFFQFVEEFREVFPDRRVEPAFLELVHPSISAGIENCVKGGAEEIFVLPLMLFPGRHISQDIPGEIQTAKKRFPEVDFHYAGALALDAGKGSGKISESKMFELLQSKIARVERAKETLT